MGIRALLRKVVGYFLRGIIFTVPIVVTVWVGFYLYTLLTTYGIVETPWISFLITIFGVTAIGFLVSSFLFRPFVRLMEDFLSHVPGVKFIYTAIKDFVEALAGEKKRFNQPVLVRYIPDSNLERIGFITQEDLSFFKIEDKVAVYIPMSYSFSGNLFIVPVKDITPLEGVDSAELMKFILAGGVTDANILRKSPQKLAAEAKAGANQEQPTPKSDAR